MTGSFPKLRIFILDSHSISSHFKDVKIFSSSVSVKNQFIWHKDGKWVSNYWWFLRRKIQKVSPYSVEKSTMVSDICHREVNYGIVIPDSN